MAQTRSGVGAFEKIATQIYQQFLSQFSTKNITWVEHYNKNSYKYSGNYPEVFEQVILSWNPKTREFHSPKWQRYLQKWQA